MKRILSLTLALLLCLSLFVACKDNGDKEGGNSTDKQKEVIPPETVLHSSLYEYNLEDYVKLAPNFKYENMLLSQSFIDKAVQDDIKDFLRAYGTVAEYDDADKLIETDDIVELYYTGYAHDKSVTLPDDILESMTNADNESGMTITIGSGGLIGAYESEEHPERNNPGFEDQLIDHKKGDKFTITVTCPDDYGDGRGAEELNGLVVDFDIEIVSISYIVEKDITVELIKEYTAYTSVEDFKKDSEIYFKKYHTYQGLMDVIKVEGKPDEGISEGDMIIEFLFKDLGLEITQGIYEEKLKEHYEVNAAYYFYYFGITSVETLETSMGKDAFILFFEEDMIKDKLIEFVTMID